jgi:uncharacterized DUF497 family protein
MAPLIEEFRASVAAQQHMLGDHDVTLDEAVEAAGSSQRHYRTYSGRSGERRYIVAGKTADGRRLWVVFADEGARRGRIITAYEPATEHSLTQHRRRRGD